MNLLLDMKTVFIVLVFGHIFSVILITAYWQQHKNNKTLNTFFIAKLTQAMAWLFLALRGGIPDIFTISVANSLLFIGTAFETIAVLKLLKSFHKSTKKLYISLTILNIIGFHLIILINNMESIRIAFASMGTVTFIILPAYLFLRNRNTTSLLMKIMGYLYTLLIVSLLGRGLSALLSSNAIGLFTPGINQSFAFLAVYLTMFLGNMGFILLLKEQSDQELIRMASYDDLTNALNRRTFVSRAKQYINHYKKRKQPISFILFDVDHFKQINDQNGHEAGDRVLQNLSNRINKLINSDQLFGRYGGDEFAILLPGMDENESSQYAEKIWQTTLQSTSEDYSLPYTLSIGVITIVPNEKTVIESLYICCDNALYEAKRKGRNRICRGFLHDKAS